MNTINFQKIHSLMNIYESGKNVTAPRGAVADFNMGSMNQSFQELLDLEKKIQGLQYDPDRKADLEEVKPPIKDESLFPAFLSDPVDRGLEKMAMVIYDKDGNTVGAVGESGIATFCSLIIPDVFEFGMDLSKFAEILEEMEFTVKTYPEGQGPTYAETFDKMYGRFGLKYEDVYKPRETVQEPLASNDENCLSSEEDLLIEGYAIPGWLSHLFTDYARVDDEIGIRYPQSRAAQYDSLSGKAKANLGEYQGELLKCFQEELKEQGIRSSVDLYQSIILDKEKSEEVHQAVRQRLADDSITSKFMKDFGIT